MKNKKSLLTVIAAATPLWANSGIPMVTLTMPVMILAFAPIVIIETIVIKSMLKTQKWITLKLVIFANILTTIIGLPLSNIIALVIAYCASLLPIAPLGSSYSTKTTILKATLGGYWYDPTVRILDANGNLIRPFPHEPWWYLILALTTAFFVNLFISIVMEYLYMRRSFRYHTKLKRATIFANIASYLFLVLIAIVFAR